MFDPNKLPPAPWLALGPWLSGEKMIALIGGMETGRELSDEERNAIAEFCAIARNAFESDPVVRKAILEYIAVSEMT